MGAVTVEYHRIPLLVGNRHWADPGVCQQMRDEQAVREELVHARITSLLRA
jgi:hypothetical protein